MAVKKGTLEVTESNRLAWNASAAHHRDNAEWQKLKKGFASPDFSTIDATLAAILAGLPIEGQSLVQIGCNNGRELLSAMSIGAKSGLGIDQSSLFIDQACELTALAGRDCKYVTSNIYELPSDMPKNFDIALITIGVLNWMPDIEKFFEVVSGLLRTSGKLVIYETHPFLEVFDPRAADPHTPVSSYFKRSPFVLEEAIVYDDSEPVQAPASYWFVHQLSEIINACINAGLSIQNVGEYPHSNRESEYDLYENREAQLPMCFSLVASKV